MMTEILAVLKTLVNWALKSYLWPHFHLQTFTEHLLLVGYRESLPIHQVCETQPDSKGYWSHIIKESQIQKKKKSKNVFFLNLYCNISDLTAETQVLVYFCYFFSPHFISATLDTPLDLISPTNITFPRLWQQNA